MTTASVPGFVTDVAGALRVRGLPLGPDDVESLRSALRAGFGWSSRDELARLCVTLWAKSAREADVVRAALQRVDLPDLDPPLPAAATHGGEGDEDQLHGAADAGEGAGEGAGAGAVASPVAGPDGVPRTSRADGLPPVPAPPLDDRDRRLVLTPRFPLSERTIAQAWRRVRRPVRSGPPVELDVAATIDRRCRQAVVATPVLVPRRRNTASLLLLVDVGGSMTPYQDYVRHVCEAIRHAGRLDRLDVRYFRNVPGASPDRGVLDELTEPFGIRLDAVLTRIGPLVDGRVYSDERLSEPASLADFFAGLAPATSAAVISDAGAARGHFDSVRLVDSIALCKALRATCGMPAWLNPTPPRRWTRSTAGQLRRHVPMFALADKNGVDRAVDVLRGRPASVDRPL